MPSILYIIFLFDLNKNSVFLISIFLCFALVQRTVDFHWYRTEYTNIKFLGYNIFNTTTEALIVRVKFITYIHQWIQLFPYLKDKTSNTNLLLPLKTRRKRFLILGKAQPRWPTSLSPGSTNIFNHLHHVIATSSADMHHRFLLGISRHWDIQGLWMLRGQSLLRLWMKKKSCMLHITFKTNTIICSSYSITNSPRKVH